MPLGAWAVALSTWAALTAAGAPAAAPAHRAAGARHAPRVERYLLHSALLHRSLGEVLVLPAGGAIGDGRPLLVLLHGRGATPDGWLSANFFGGLAATRGRAPDVLLVNGGDHSYYHDRADGPWGGYVMREAIPDGLRRAGADPTRLAIGGISMGGFGALDIARRYRGRFCAVGGHSAALWESWPDTAPGAFDDGSDFARHDVVGAARRSSHLYGNARVWLDGGLDDPFRTADEDLAAALHTPQGAVTMHHWPGAHDFGYWDAHVARYLAFYANALAACPSRVRHKPSGATGPHGTTGPHGATGPSGPSGPTGPGGQSGGASPGG
jgi:S-formylglutathione hydrolase FrmB